MKIIRWYGPTVVLMITVLAVMVIGPPTARRLATEYRDEKIRVVSEDLRNTPTLAELSESFRKVAMVVEHSVVHIEVLGNPHRGLGLGDLFEDREDATDPDTDTEPDEEPGRAPRSEYQPLRPFANGSGWVYDRDGHIITNHHVIERAEKILVRFYDGRQVEAEMVGADTKTDVAVLKVKGNGLHPAARAGEEVAQGEIVFAFGSPFKFDFSMSQGIISAIHRRNLGILGPGGYEDFIQTDAAINPGNSGGPLTNIRGEVIGMNTAIAASGGRSSYDASFSGLGFAIPVKMVEFVADQIIADGKVERGYLGVIISDLSPGLAATFGFRGDGVLVDRPNEDGPAYAAGLRRGDIVTRINGETVASVAELRSIVSQHAPNSVLNIELARDGKVESIEPKITRLPERLGIPILRVPLAGVPVLAAPDELKRIGIETVSLLTEDLASRAGMEFQPGVIVRSIRRGSLAATPDLSLARQNGGLTRSRLSPESIITHVMGKSVADADELVAELNSHDLSSGVRISVIDGGVPRYVMLVIPDGR